jgi:hypothetical protein
VKFPEIAAIRLHLHSFMAAVASAAADEMVSQVTHEKLYSSSPDFPPKGVNPVFCWKLLPGRVLPGYWKTAPGGGLALLKFTFVM